MASIVAGGIGSGLDVHNLVTQLVSAERAPAEQRFKGIESTAKAQISAFGSLRGTLSTLESALDAFKREGADPGRKAVLPEGAGFLATASAKAVPGSYGIRVERIATAHKLQSPPLVADAPVGQGTLVVQVGDRDPVEIDIAEGSTLADVRDAINAVSGEDGPRASLVRGDAGDVLVLTSPHTGADGAIQVSTAGGDAALAEFAGTLSEATAPADAEIWVDGIKRTSSSNHLDDLIDGVTLDLTRATPGESTTLEIQPDSEALQTRLDEFIKAYNGAITELRKQTAAGSEGVAGGTLSGDSTARSISQGLRDGISSAYAELSALGLKTSVDGTLSLDKEKFNAALASNGSAVQGLLGDGGTLSTALRGTLEAYIGDDGLIDDRTESLNNRMDRVADQREALDRRMESLEARYRRQFTALDSMMAQMQSTSSFLMQQLAGLSG